ncbi:hypothetical protein [uncultured Nostoc sp.]|uniref:hypothetical protein n=1 Tax=uncultured Nostoc sp. TaxID=340711 RepID=UPI0035C9A9DE
MASVNSRLVPSLACYVKVFPDLAKTIFVNISSLVAMLMFLPGRFRRCVPLSTAINNSQNGLANENEYDQVGRNFFAHPCIFGVGVTKSETGIGIGYNIGNIVSLDFPTSENPQEHIGGFSLLSLNGAGLGVIAVDLLQHLYGQELKNTMYQLPKFLGMIAFCESLPNAENIITLVPEKKITLAAL